MSPDTFLLPVKNYQEFSLAQNCFQLAAIAYWLLNSIKAALVKPHTPTVQRNIGPDISCPNYQTFLLCTLIPDKIVMHKTCYAARD